MTLARFYPIFDDVSWLRDALALGVKLVQLRIKTLPYPALKTQIAQAKALCQKYGAVLVVNDHWQLALDLGIAWVHLGQEDMQTADIAALRKNGVRLGISTHDEAELENALAVRADYIALGPIYPTKLKKMRWHRQGLGRLREWKEAIGATPLVAIGGMTVERAHGAFANGADTIAAVTDITLNTDPQKRIQEWLHITQTA